MKTVLAYTFQNVVEESRIRTALEGEGIEVLVRSFEDSAYNGIFTLQKGNGQIRVFEKDAEKAKKIIEECCSQTNINEGLEENK
ncbi:DUF2007 domain-containing protein [candidate division NPL-UPA2 bacterium]|nr:DUF2007 domain-containing protein [candidate division NPL-UPA2 bacterium]